MAVFRILEIISQVSRSTISSVRRDNIFIRWVVMPMHTFYHLTGIIVHNKVGFAAFTATPSAGFILMVYPLQAVRKILVHVVMFSIRACYLKE